MTWHGLGQKDKGGILYRAGVPVTYKFMDESEGSGYSLYGEPPYLTATTLDVRRKKR